MEYILNIKDTDGKWVGIPAIKGEPGIDGINGVAGLSAYQIAVNNGYVGTEAEWLLFLKGKDGTPGVKGDTGIQGTKGDAGADGRAATISVGTVTTGSTGTNVIVTNTGTSSAAVFNFTIPRGNTGGVGGTGPQGPTGPQGATGSQGPRGYDGSTGSPGQDAVFNANQSYTLSGSNTFTAYNFITSSDKRLKSNIKELSSNILFKIRAKSFNMYGTKRVGYIAQDVEKIDSSFVSEFIQDGITYKALSYTDIHTALISELTNKVIYLEQKVNDLEERLARLETLIK